MIPVAEPDLRGNELAYVTEAVTSGWISSAGSYVTRFEEGFAAYCGVERGIATCNGTAALNLALAAAEIGPGDEVIVPTFTFVATANAVRHVGGTPVFADVDRATWLLDPASTARAITPRTRAILAVHLYGHPCDMDALMALGRQHGLLVIEDAAEAHGARYRGRRVGGLGDISCFSFYGNKLLTTGEGGMVLTSDAALAERALTLRDHGMSKERRYWHEVVGFNFRMTNLQAAIGVAQLERLDEMIARKREIVALYQRELAGCAAVEGPPNAAWAESVYWLYTILLRDAARVGRDALIDGLRSRGVDARPTFFPIHTLPPYATGQSFPVSEDIGARGLSLPSSTLLTDDQVRQVVAVLRDLV